MSMQTAPKTDGKAVGSLICGIGGLLCLPLIPSVIAVILGHMSLSSIKRSQGTLTGDGLAIGGLITGYLGLAMGLVVFGMAALMLPALSQAREKARRVNCAGNLKQIGLACLMYSGENSGAFPPDLATLDEQGVLNAGRVYCCPSAENFSVPFSAADIRAGKSSYLYLGAGLRDDDPNPTNTVIACDKPGNHGDGWINALFIDGHVEGTKAGSIEEAARQRGWIIPGKSLPQP